MLNDTLNTENASSSILNPQFVEGELRILDTDLAKRLGFANPIDIRKLIRRHETALKQIGVFATVAKTQSSAGGRPSTEYYLNRKQAIFLTAKSETPQATDITIEIIERFDAYERGEQPAFQIPQTYSEALRLAADQAEEIKTLKPKAEGYARIALADGSVCVTDAAKTLQINPKTLFTFLQSKEWIYRRSCNSHFCGYQDKIKAGYLEHKVNEISRSDGSEKIIEQVRVTPKGLAKLAAIFSSTQTETVQ